MKTLRGTVSNVHQVDAGIRIGLTFRPDDGGTLYLVAPQMTRDAALGLLVRNAAEMADVVEIDVEAFAPRLGAPYGTVAGIRTVEHGGARGLARAA